jgi:hypothetical protein
MKDEEKLLPTCVHSHVAKSKQYDPKNMQSVFDFFEYLQKQFG